MKEQTSSNTVRKIQLNINGARHDVEVDENMPLLWVLRDELGLSGTKYGCGVGLCGSCTVLVDGETVRSCQINVGKVTGKITTIEGLGNAESLHVVQQAWIKHQVAQCGYCQPGQVMSAYGLLTRNPNPSNAELEAAMIGNLCRCGTYARIRKAIETASKCLNNNSPKLEEK